MLLQVRKQEGNGNACDTRQLINEHLTGKKLIIRRIHFKLQLLCFLHLLFHLVKKLTNFNFPCSYFTKRLAAIKSKRKSSKALQRWKQRRGGGEKGENALEKFIYLHLISISIASQVEWLLNLPFHQWIDSNKRTLFWYVIRFQSVQRLKGATVLQLALYFSIDTRILNVFLSIFKWF